MSNKEEIASALHEAIDLIEQAMAILATHIDKLPPGQQRDTAFALMQTLAAKRQEALVAKAIASYSSSKVQAALAALKKIADENDEIAGHLKKAADWLDNAGTVLTQAKKAVDAIETLVEHA
jgi:hypothetical protein